MGRKKIEWTVLGGGVGGVGRPVGGVWGGLRTWIYDSTRLVTPSEDR